MINELKEKVTEGWRSLDIWVKLRIVAINVVILPFVFWSMAASIWLFLPLFIGVIIGNAVVFEALLKEVEKKYVNGGKEAKRDVEDMIGWDAWYEIRRALRDGKKLQIVDPDKLQKEAEGLQAELLG